MSYEEAIEILHPATTLDAVAKHDNFREAVNEACIVACEAMKKLIKLEEYINEGV